MDSVIISKAAAARVLHGLKTTMEITEFDFCTKEKIVVDALSEVITLLGFIATAQGDSVTIGLED